jgi:hypothetical protein
MVTECILKNTDANNILYNNKNYRMPLIPIHNYFEFQVGAETGYGEALDRSSYGSYASSYNECPGIPIALLLITLIGIGNTANRPFYQIIQQILVDSVLRKSWSLTIPCCLTQSMLGSSSLWSEQTNHFLIPCVLRSKMDYTCPRRCHRCWAEKVTLWSPLLP